ncbi:MAG: ABC transporter ATP-binding protein [Desulfovibrionaceae bacterium]
MIRLDGVVAGYGGGSGATVLHGIDLAVGRGEMVGVLGPNGSGKTTLLLTMSGMLAPRAGRVSVQGRDAADLRPRERARAMAAVPQRLDGAFDLRVFALALMGRYPYISWLGGYTDADEAKAWEALRATHTDHFAHRLAGELSGGEYQRVLIARALAQEADILLLDEAASGLDVARKREVYDLLRERNRHGATIVSAIHDLNLAALYCDRLVFLKQGRIVLDGPTASVFTARNLTEIYETPITVIAHPATGAPQGLMAPGVPGGGGGAAPDGDR